MKRTFPLLATMALALAAPVSAGVYFSAVTTAEGRPGGPMAGATVRVWVQGEKVRIEYSESRNPLLKAGRFLLTLDGGSSIYLVDPTERTFSLWDADAAVWSTVQTAATPSGARVERLGEEDGGELLGMPTRHFRYRTGAADADAAMKAQSAPSVVVEEDLWVSPQLAEAALGIWLRQAGQAGDATAAGAAEAEADERFSTFPLKRVAVTTTTARNGRRTVVTTTTTVTELSVEEVSPGTFTMGSGYREKPLAPASGRPGEQPMSGETGESSQEDQQYPFEEMLQPEAAPAAPTAGQPVAPGHTPQAGARPVVPPTPLPVVPEEPQEDPEYPFARMLDTVN